MTVAVDGYYRQSAHLIDEGQFGAPIDPDTLQLCGRQDQRRRVQRELHGRGLVRLRQHLVFERARRKIESSQFDFGQDELDYISTHSIHLDHEQRVTASAGASWLVADTRLSADLLFGTGLRADLTLPDGSDVPNGDHLPTYAQVNLSVSHVFRPEGSSGLTARFDVINAFDKIYQIRDGSGVRVGAPQYGPRRGLFFGLSKAL